MCGVTGGRQRLGRHVFRKQPYQSRYVQKTCGRQTAAGLHLLPLDFDLFLRSHIMKQKIA